MIKKTTILLTSMAVVLLAACTADDIQQAEAGRTPIRLTTSIARTRAVTPTQETVIATGQNIYVWANEEATPGTADWSQNAYISAWRLTKGDGSPNEWSSQSSTPYYPPRPMSMIALHGNFQPAIVEERAQVPATITHQVKTDQRLLADYAASDLLYWKATNVLPDASNTPIAMQFDHKLSKIEIELTSDAYTADELAGAIITLNGLQTSVTITATDATPGNMGNLSAAAGDAQIILPYAAVGNQREAIVPPQAKPANLITVTLNGQTYTLSPAEPTTEFAANTRYHYTLTLNKTSITATATITAWGTNSATTTDTKPIAPINVKMNPLWYVAETNVDYTAADGSKTWDSGAGKFYFSTTKSGGYYFSWADAMKYFTTTANYNAGSPSSVNGYYESSNDIMRGWHLPCSSEWNSIFPSCSSDNSRYSLPGLVSDDATGTIYSASTPVCFGYNDITKGTSGDYMLESSYWYRKNSSLFYAIRYCGTEFCSAWKYEWVNNSLIISCTLLGTVLTAEDAQTIYGTDESNWSSIIFDNNENIGAVQRSFYCTGHVSTAYSGNSPNFLGERGNYWTSTIDPQNSSYTRYFHFYNTNTLTIANSTSTNGDVVRLFRDNPDKDVLKNPLFYVAEYNMTNAVNAATLTMAAADDAGYYYRWVDAMSTFGTSSTSYNGYKKGNKTISGKTGTWHLPTISEFRSIIPNVNIWTDSNYDANGDGYYSHNVGVVWGCNYETKTIGVRDSMFIHKVSNYEVHAIRFLGTPYCSAWKYTIANNTLTISATMIDYIENIMYNAKKFYDEKWPSIYFGNDASKGAVQRRFYERGWIVSSSNTSGPNWNAEHDNSFWFWSATQDSNDNTKGMGVYSSGETSGFGCSSTTKTYSFPIRLFLDN